MDETTPRIGDNSGAVPLAERIADENAAALADLAKLAARANALPEELKTDEHLAEVAEVIKDARKVSSVLDAARVEAVKPHLDMQRDLNAAYGTHTNRLDRIITALKGRANALVRKREDDERVRRAIEAQKAREEADRQAAIARKAEEDGRTAAATKAAHNAKLAEEHAQTVERNGKADDGKRDITRSESGAKAGQKMETVFTIDDYNAIPLDVLRPYFKRTVVEDAVKAFMKVNGVHGKLAGVTFSEEARATFR